MQHDVDFSAQSLAGGIKPAKDSPSIILSVAPCRSGTTALLRVFAQNDIPAMYQPIKAILRRRMNGEESMLQLPSADTLFIKETLGPYTYAESAINPLEVLINAGIPSESIKLLIMMREPVGTISSWVEQFSLVQGRSLLIENAISAYRNVVAIDRQAYDLGISTQHYVYEALRDNDPELLFERLFQQLELPFDVGSLYEWNTLPSLEADPKIIFPNEPESYRSVRGTFFHEKVESSSGLCFYPKEVEKIDSLIGVEDITRLEDAGVFDMYDSVRLSSAHELGLIINESEVHREFALRQKYRRSGERIS